MSSITAKIQNCELPTFWTEMAKLPRSYPETPLLLIHKYIQLSGEVGEGSVYDEQNNVHYRAGLTHPYYSSSFHAYVEIENKEVWVGCLRFEVIDEIACRKMWGTDYASYGPNTPENYLSKVKVKTLDNLEDHFKGVGTLLMLTAFQFSFREKCEGRLMCDVSGFSHCFYFKFGMRSAKDRFDTEKFESLEKEVVAVWKGKKEPTDDFAEKEAEFFAMKRMSEKYKDYDKLIQDEITLAQKENRKPCTTNIGGLNMYLPHAAIEAWKKTINQQSVLY